MPWEVVTVVLQGSSILSELGFVIIKGKIQSQAVCKSTLIKLRHAPAILRRAPIKSSLIPGKQPKSKKVQSLGEKAECLMQFWGICCSIDILCCIYLDHLGWG
jgi:hypothetical protein